MMGWGKRGGAGETYNRQKKEGGIVSWPKKVSQGEGTAKKPTHEATAPPRRSPGIACRSRKGSPFGDRRLRRGNAPPALCRTPCARLGVPEVRPRRARSAFAVWAGLRFG